MADQERDISEEAEAPATELVEPLGEPVGDLVPPIAPAKRQGGLLGGILGGAIAAAAGFGLALVAPNGWPFGETNELAARSAEQALQIDDLKSQVATLATASADPEPGLADLTNRLSALETTIKALPAAPSLDQVELRLEALEATIAAIAAVPGGGTGASAAAFAAQAKTVSEMSAQIAELKRASDAVAASVSATTSATAAQLEASEAQTVALVQSAKTLAALSQVQVALEAGGPFSAPLEELGVDVDPTLVEAAKTGVLTIIDLQNEYPAAARLALQAALLAHGGESWTERAASFLRSQTGARSLTPREGTDPDAVLSRAEAAVASADLTAALTELATLPSEAQAAMAEWRGKAETRLAAVAAFAELSRKLRE